MAKLTAELKEKTTKIERLKAVIVFQESSIDKMTNKFSESLQNKVDNWISNDYTDGNFKVAT